MGQLLFMDNVMRRLSSAASADEEAGMMKWRRVDNVDTRVVSCNPVLAVC